MTLLLSKCPFCDSNFMLLNTEQSKGQCVLCGKDKQFDQSDIEKAESRRDSLMEKYIGRLEEAFANRDEEKMLKLAGEVAEEGISSWYAWFCVGWSDLQEGKTGQAFDDFNLAAYFLDEENYDEFYELTMDAVLTSLEDAAREGRQWSDENTSMVQFTGTMFERFESLTEQDFMSDLVLRIGTLSDSLDNALMGASLIKEVMMITLDYMSGNIYIVDQIDYLNNAKSAVDSIDAAMKERAQDGSMAPKTVEIWGSGFSEFLQMLIDGEGELLKDYGDVDLLMLSDYWNVNDYEDVFNLLQTAFDSHVGYMMSGKRNKGILKKRDTAVKGFLEALGRPLAEGIADSGEEVGEGYDRICPDCGKQLTADESGLMVCECGFKSRIVTDDIEDLPENVPELTIMGRKAFMDRDSRMLNNLGERILEFEQDNWHGFIFLAASCALDGQIGEAVMMVVQAAACVPTDDRKEFRDISVEILADGFAKNDDPEQNMASIFVTSLFEALDGSVLKDCGIPMAIIERMKDGEYITSVRGSLATLIIEPTLHHRIASTTSLITLKRDIASCVELLDAVDAGMKGIKKDAYGLRDDVSNYSKTMHDLFGYTISSIDSLIGASGEEKIGYLAGYWAANREGYDSIADTLIESLSFDPDSAYSPKSKAISKSKHGIDRYLDSYVNVKSS